MKKTRAHMPSSNPTMHVTEEIPLGLGRLRTPIWVSGGWVGANIYTAEPLMDDLQSAIDSLNLRNGSPGCPTNVKVRQVETFCLRVKPYSGRSLSAPQRERLCAEYADKIVASLEGRLVHVVCWGESRFRSQKGRKAA